jgi:glyoxylase-like metal-dependent hydrolase (beta-lactamase superfamily II)
MSKLRTAAPTLALLAAAGALSAQNPSSVVARAVAATGGEAAIRALTATAADFHTVTWQLGQEETFESPARATVAYGRITTDWAGHRRVTQQDVRLLTGAVPRQRRVTAGGIGMLETDGRPAPDVPAQVAAAERAMRLAPERLLLAAMANPAGLSALPPRDLRGEPHDGVRYALGPDTLDLWFDRRSGLLTATSVTTDDPILGDRTTATWYTRYAPLNGVRIPRQVDVTVNGRLQNHTVYTTISAVSSAEAAMFAIPDSIAARAQRPGPPPPVSVQMVELAPGVWRAEGGSHHTLVVEQRNQLVMVEAPQSRARTQAVLDTLRSRWPNKRVGVVVSTHHHWDHSGGVRTALANGLPVIVHGRNAGFVRQVAAARKTVSPDELTRRPRQPSIQTVEDSMVIGDGETPVVLYAVPTVHGEGLLAAYVPSGRILFTADVLNPAAVLSASGSAEMVAFARSRGLTVDRYAGAHGAVTAWSAVEAAAAR